jgi:hypothetical protein
MVFDGDPAWFDPQLVYRPIIRPIIRLLVQPQKSLVDTVHLSAIFPDLWVPEDCSSP